MVKGKVYESEKTGLIKELGRRHISKGTILFPQKHMHAVKKKLEEFGIEYKGIDIWLGEDDMIKLCAWMEEKK